MLHPVKKVFEISGFYTFFEFCYAEDYYFEGEHHNFWEVVYCLDGAVGVSADEKILQLRPGDLMIYRPMIHHRLWSEEDTYAHIIVVSFETDGLLPESLVGAYSCDEYLRDQWEDIFLSIKKSGCKKSLTGYLHYLDQYPYLYQQVANQIVNCLLGLQDHGLPLGYNQSKKALAYERIIQVMKQNLSENLTADEISRICGLSVSSMKKLFHSFNSMGIHEYYLHLKIMEAVRLLESGKNVTETAELLGFSSQSYFSTAFKREMGEIPGRFRRNKD